MWEDAAEANHSLIEGLYYSTNLFAERAVGHIRAAGAASKPLYIHLTWQAV